MEMRHPVAFFLAVALLLSCFSGCTDSENGKIAEEETPSANTKNNSISYKPHVVVAYIDSGINPYHIQFRRPNMTEHPSKLIPGYPLDAAPINLTFGDSYLENFAIDNSVFSEIQEKKLYYQ